MKSRADLLLLVAFCGFLFFYGLGSFGLVGADEPRYAQVAREMLDRGDWITPTLQGQPWLEKPPLYYWQAMATYAVARALSPGTEGVTDQTARIPSAIDAALLILVVYIFLRRLRPGSEIDGALIVASSAGIIGYARAASPDMPLAAAFAIAMLAWYSWYDDKRRLHLAGFYTFLALATLAKGPVAPFLAAVIVLVFTAVKRDWRTLLNTLWVPGILLYLAVALPWYIAVQLRNPQFFRIFILQHNLGRFTEDLYHHQQPFWYYLPVLLLATMPWIVWLVLAIVEKARLFWPERQQAFTASEDTFELFLLIWLLVPVLFFSFSQSKLPGYILPGIPAGALLVNECLSVQRKRESRLSLPLAAIHGIVCGGLVFAALTSATVVVNQRLAPGTAAYVAAGVGLVIASLITMVLRSRTGIRLLRVSTLAIVVICIAAVLRLAAPSIDGKLSSRPIAQAIQSFSHESVPIAVYGTNREQEYGLEFYFNRPVQKYTVGQIPTQAHVLVVTRNALEGFMPRLPGRKITYLIHVPGQNVDLYYVSAGPESVPSTQ